LPKRAVEPCAGAANVTVTPATALPSASLTVTAGRIGKRVPTRVDSPDAEPAAIAAGLPARFRSVNLAELPPPVTAAVAAKLPALPFATTAGDVARPFASVVAVAWLAPPANVAPAPVAACGSVNVTVAPSTGPPRASPTRACSGPA